MSTIEEKIGEWAKSEPSMKKYTNSNLKLLKEFYRTKYVAKKISDCLEGQNADLELVILEEQPRKPIMLCNKCKHKVCLYDCGKKEYVEHTQKGYLAIDVDGQKIVIDISPFYNGSIKELEIEQVYCVKGKIKEYNKKLYITADAVVLGNLNNFQ